MKKTLVSLLLVLVLATSCIVTASAASSRWVVTPGGGPIGVWSEPYEESEKLPLTFNYGDEVRAEKNMGNGFTRITLAGAYDCGYVHTKYLSKTKPSTKPTSTTTTVNWAKFKNVYYQVMVVPKRSFVNFRWYPSEESSKTIQKEMLYGHTLWVLATNGTWSQVYDESDHTSGFVKNQFLVPITDTTDAD